MREHRVYSFLNHNSVAKYKTVIINHTTNNNGNKKRGKKGITGEILIKKHSYVSYIQSLTKQQED
jgi:hypothetical protein